MTDDELLVPAKRCPECSHRLNLRVTPALREQMRGVDEPSERQLTVQCAKYQPRQGRRCGAIVELTAEDLARAHRR